MDERPISNLNGYLLSLRRLSGNACDFWAEVFPCSGDVEDCFRVHLAGLGVSLVGKSRVGYEEIDQILRREVFSKLVVEDESLLRVFSWDVVEYLQMSYRLTKPEIDPIFNNQSLLFKAHSELHGEYVYLVVPVNEKAIAVGFAARA